ncbi:hypothetical protein MTO96_006358 [Rhipicephalus appendiculatus]
MSMYVPSDTSNDARDAAATKETLLDERALGGCSWKSEPPLPHSCVDKRDGHILNAAAHGSLVAPDVRFSANTSLETPCAVEAERTEDLLLYGKGLGPTA